MYSRYTAPFYFWEVIILLRKLGVVFCFVFLTQHPRFDDVLILCGRLRPESTLFYYSSHICYYITVVQHVMYLMAQFNEKLVLFYLLPRSLQALAGIVVLQV